MKNRFIKSLLAALPIACLLLNSNAEELDSIQVGEASNAQSAGARCSARLLANGDIEVILGVQDRVFSREELDVGYGFEVIRAEAHCDPKGYSVGFSETSGPNLVTTFHVFDLEYRFKKEYFIESTNNHLVIMGSIVSRDAHFQSYVQQQNLDRDVHTLFEFYGFQQELEPEIDPFYESVKNSYNAGDTDYLSVASDRLVIDELLRLILIDRSNVSKYNDIGYYFERSGLFHEAVYLLENVIEEFPNRTVAYINLGDAYWELGETEKAKQAYQNYIALMKEAGRESRIPEAVLNRVEK